MLLDDLEVYHKIAGPLMRPNSFTSLNQLSKRLRLPDDKVIRAVTRLGARLRCELITRQNRRLVLTEQGERIARIANQLYAAVASDSDDAPEVLAVDADSTLAESILPNAMESLLSAWGGLVVVQLRRLDPDPAVLRERLTNATVSLGLGFADGDPPASAEVLDPSFPWTALLPASHPLGGTEHGFSPEALSRAERVFVPERGATALAGVLHAVPPVRRVECESAAVVRSMVAAGLGIGLDLDLGRLSVAVPQGFRRVPLLGVEPERIALFLPRKSDVVSEATLSLITAIKQAVSTASEPTPEARTAEAPADAELATV